MRRLSIVVAAAGLVMAAGAPTAQASNDLFWGQQYGPQQIHAASAWQATRGDGVIIAIVDSGVDVDHPDLASKLVIVPGSDLSDGDDNPDDDSERTDGAGKKVKGHGTHVAGIAAAVTDNAEGIAGVAPNARIMPLKVFPSGTDRGVTAVALDRAAIPRAINMAVNNGAKVINLSLGTFFGSSGLVGTIETPCQEALQRGALCVVTAGNGGEDQDSGYPHQLDAVVVTSNGQNREHSQFGQVPGTKWGISAPGEFIQSTVPVENGGYAALSGTSMAAPHVAGVAALLFAQGLSAPQVAERLMATADPSPDGDYDGHGIVNAAAAVGAPVVAELDSPTGGGAPPSPPINTPGGSTAGAGGEGGRAGGEGGAPVPTTPDGQPAPTAAANPNPAAELEFGVEVDDEQAISDTDDDGGPGTMGALAVLGGLLVLVVGGSMLRNRFG